MTTSSHQTGFNVFFSLSLSLSLKLKQSGMEQVVSMILLLILLAHVSFIASIEFQHLHVHELLLSTSQTHLPKKTNSHHHDNKLILPVVHRDTVSGQNHSRHQQLRFQELMERDSHRVASLTRRLTGSTQSSYSPEDFGSEVVSGLEEGSGEYFVRVGVGSPAKDQYLVIDSGSDVTWVQCQPCSQCYDQREPVFDPTGSISFTGVSCNSAVCSQLGRAATCRSGQCGYEVSYGDGSYTKGSVALETLTFGPTQVRKVAMGCGHRNRGLFVGASGVLGLGGGPMSLVGQLDSQTGGAFAYCLASRGMGTMGSLVFGRAAAVPIGATWVPLLRNPRAANFYYIGLVGVGVGGTRLPVPEDVFGLSELGEGGVVMDTGTAVTRLPALAYEVLRNAFVATTVGLPRAPGKSIFDTCYNLFGFGTVRVPTVSFYFSSGAALTLPARNFLIPVDRMGNFCLAFAPSASGLSILGNIQQEGIQITFDAANGFVGFGPNTC